MNYELIVIRDVSTSEDGK